MQHTPYYLRALTRLLNKPAKEFQRKDLLRIIKEQEIQQLNLHYVGLDDKLKELKIPTTDLQYAERILAHGERIDGSNIFPKIVDPACSDLYIVPIYKTAFISPFENNTMGILCRFMDKNGTPANYTPDNILIAAHEQFQKTTGYSFNALGELEFYLIYNPAENELFCGTEQRGYQQAAPFSKKSIMLNEMLEIISSITSSVKYAHSEVGYIQPLKSTLPEINGKTCEQYEIEFLPRPVEDMAMYLHLAKWVVRNVAHKWNCTATFTPKLEEGMAGTGLHIHMELTKNGKNAMTDANGELSEASLKLIGGLCKHAASLTAFGNSVSSAYLRLVSNQEAPTKICWSRSNRASLIRVPLGWTNTGDMAKVINPQEKENISEAISGKQTIEIRTPDGSAYVSLLLAALTLLVEKGLLSNDALEIAQQTHLPNDPKLSKQLIQNFKSLPASCAESADALERERELYQNLFPPAVIDYVITELRLEDDRNLNEHFSHLPADKRLKATRDLMHRHLHKH